jgi:hypothetical protein
VLGVTYLLKDRKNVSDRVVCLGLAEVSRVVERVVLKHGLIVTPSGALFDNNFICIELVFVKFALCLGSKFLTAFILTVATFYLRSFFLWPSPSFSASKRRRQQIRILGRRRKERVAPTERNREEPVCLRQESLGGRHTWI